MNATRNTGLAADVKALLAATEVSRKARSLKLVNVSPMPSTSARRLGLVFKNRLLKVQKPLITPFENILIRPSELHFEWER